MSSIVDSSASTTLRPHQSGPPDLAIACPQLESLHLAFRTYVHGDDGPGFMAPSGSSPSIAVFALATRLLGSANTTSLVSAVLGICFNDYHGKGPATFAGDWAPLAHAFDKFPNLTSVKVFEAAFVGVTFVTDLHTPLESVYQAELRRLSPSLDQRGLLQFV